MSKEPPPPAADEAGRRYQSLLAITEAISSHQDISELFRDLPGQLRRAVDFDAVAVVLHDPARDVMRLHLFEARIPLAYPPPPEGPVDASPAGVVWRTQEPLLISPVAEETRFPQFVELLRAHEINTLYEAPLTSSGRRLGSIAFGSRRPHAYGEADLEFLRHVAKQVAVAVENALNFERATREGARAQLLLEINNAVVSHLDLEELVRTVSASLRDLLPHDAAGIALYEPELNQLREYTNVAYKDLDAFRVGETIPLEGTPAGQVFLTGRPMLIRRPNPAAYPADRYSQRPVEGSPKSACLALLMSHGRKLGIAGVSSTQVERFTDEDLELFSQIAGQIAIAVENSLNFRNAARERDRRQLLLEVSNAVVSNLSLKDLLLAVSGCLKQFFDHDYASIVLYDEEAGLLRVHALDALAPGGGHSEGSLLPIEGTPAGLAIKTRETILRERLDLNEFDAPETRLAYEAGLRSGCSVPLISHDRVLGTINVASLRDAAFTEADAELLGQVAHQVAIALENALNFERARAAEQEVSRKLERERLMLEINNAVVSQLSLRELVRVVSQCLREVLRPDVTGISLYDPETNQFRAYMFDLPDNLPAIEEGTPMPLEGTVGGMAFTSGRPIFMSRPDPEVSVHEFDRRLIEGGIKSGGVVPLIAHDRKLGFLGVGSFREDAFSEADQELLCHTANQIAIAVENALNFERATKERERAETLLEVNNAIATNRNIRDLLRATSRCLRAYFRHDFAALSLYDEKTGMLHVHAFDLARPDTDIYEGEPVPVEGTLSGLAFTTRRAVYRSPVNVEETSAPMARRFFEQQGLQSFCCVPLVSHGRAVGIIALGSRQPDAMTAEDVELFERIGGQIAIGVENAVQYRQIEELKNKLASEKLYLEEEIKAEYNFGEIVGQSRALKRVLEAVETVAPTDSVVLICGETGTGKELVARAIHSLSARRERTLVKLNCAAIPTGLLESELFGHEKGAFTGAITQRIGRFELAHKGTLLLDEVGEIPLELQPKLLRVLQEQEFERLGSSRTVRTDVRLIAATNCDLQGMVAEKKFRSDLFYRLNVFPIVVPPLRERAEDVPLLVSYFAQKHSLRMNKRVESIPAAAMRALRDYHWPGNVRELENFVERAVILSRGPELLVPLTELKAPAAAGAGNAPAASAAGLLSMDEMERAHIEEVLRRTGGAIAGRGGAAEILGLPASTLRGRMKKLGLR